MQKEKEDINVLKEYIQFFKNDGEDNKKSNFAKYCRFNQQKTCKFIECQAENYDQIKP